jgi:hypothetical protein
MSKQKTLPVALLVSLLLGGCATQVVEPKQATITPVDRTLSASIERMEALMVELKGMKLPDQPISDGELITINWVGEATMLVEALAKSKGLAFSKRGAPELPLPITMVETKAAYDEVLIKIAAQITHRADLVVEDGRLVVEYRLKTVVQ